MPESKAFHFDQPETKTIENKKLSKREIAIDKLYGSKTDRQLMEEQTYLAKLTAMETKSISNNVTFFFWLTVISIAITVISLIVSKA